MSCYAQSLTVLRCNTILQVNEVAAEPADVGVDQCQILGHIRDGHANTNGIATCAPRHLQLRASWLMGACA